jgi:hypothetical protein
MAIGRRTRKKGLLASQELLGSNTRAIAYGMGLAGPDPRATTACMVVGAVGLAAFFLFVAGAIAIPGALALALIYYAIDQPVAVVVTNTGVAILTRSVVTGRPRKLLFSISHGVLADSQVQTTWRFVKLPAERVWLRKREFEFLSLATASLTHPIEQPSPDIPQALPRPQAAARPSPGWYPVDGKSDEIVYWNGRSYTARNLWRDGAWHDIPVNFYSGGPPKPEDRLAK